jgi:transposase-like protein
MWVRADVIGLLSMIVGSLSNSVGLAVQILSINVVLRNAMLLVPCDYVIGPLHLANVKQKTIEPFIKDTIDPGTLIYTDKYSIYARLCAWGYDHKSVNHGRGEFARDEDGDGFCEVHVNTMEGFWSLLRSWLRPHRGISQEKLPLYLGFFEFVHNVRKRGKALLGALGNVLRLSLLP